MVFNCIDSCERFFTLMSLDFFAHRTLFMVFMKNVLTKLYPRQKEIKHLGRYFRPEYVRFIDKLLRHRLHKELFSFILACFSILFISPICSICYK